MAKSKERVMSADAHTDPLARADVLFAELGGPALATPEQGLFSVIEADIDTARGKVYTAELVVRHQPEKARRALFLLANGWGINRIATTVGLGTHTVIALRDKFAEKVATLKEALAKACSDAALLQVERLLEDPAAVKIDNAAMTAKLMLDAAAQLRGDAPPVQRHVHTVLTAEDLREMAAGMGLVGGEFSAIAPVAPVAALGECRDSESLDIHCQDHHVTINTPKQAGGEGGLPPLPGGGSTDALPTL